MGYCVRIVFDCKRQKFNHVGLNSMGSCHMITAPWYRFLCFRDRTMSGPASLCSLDLSHVQAWGDVQPLFLLSKQEEAGTWKYTVACVLAYQGRKILKSLQQIRLHLGPEGKGSWQSVLDYVASFGGGIMVEKRNESVVQSQCLSILQGQGTKEADPGDRRQVTAGPKQRKWVTK